MMKQEKPLVDKIVAKAAYQAAKKNVNSLCLYFFYQPTVPDSLMKLKEHK